LKASTSLAFSNPTLQLRTPPPEFKFQLTTREAPENARFTIAVDGSGTIRYVFPASSSGDANLDRQARSYLVLCRFQRMPATSANDGLTWATATFEFGNDLQLPASSTERAP
jgi:hypothetical protein